MTSRTPFFNRSFILILLAGIFCHLEGAKGASLAPSRFRRFCEEALISTGIYHPPSKALVIDGDYKASALTSDVVAVQLPHQSRPELFRYTNRHQSDLYEQKLYPPDFLNIDQFKGLKVLDLACGEGQWVEDLRRQGVEAIGVDVFLRDYEKSKPYFVQSSMDDTPLPSGSFDVIMTTQGPMTYLPKDRKLMQKILREVHRLLKKGGVFRLSPIHPEDLYGARIPLTDARPEIDLQETGLWPLPSGLRVKSAPSKEWFWNTPRDDDFSTPHYWLEIERVD